MDLMISLLDFNFAIFNFAIIYIIHKIFVLIKNQINYFKDNFFRFFFKKYNRLLKKTIFLRSI